MGIVGTFTSHTYVYSVSVSKGKGNMLFTVGTIKALVKPRGLRTVATRCLHEGVLITHTVIRL